MIGLVIIFGLLLLGFSLRINELEQTIKMLTEEEDTEELGECDCRACRAERKNELLTERNETLTEGIDAAYELLICQKAANN